MMKDVKHIYMLGIGGMGMAPLAIYLRGRGLRVTGFDDSMRAEVRAHLDGVGVGLQAACELPEDADVLVYSSAVAEGHPGRIAASGRGVRQVRRGEMLAEVSAAHRLLAVVGSHGKSTTAAMLVEALHRAGQAPSYILGALFADADRPPACHAGEWLVAEVDESDGTIDGFSPDVTLVVNFDWDHPDRYPTSGALEEAFAGLFRRTRERVLLPVGCAVLGRVAEACGAPCQSYGEGADYAARMTGEDAGGLGLQLGGLSGDVHLKVAAHGAFNAHNAGAALAAAAVMGVAPTADALEAFGGLRRRQSVLHEDAQWVVVEDYAHHPAEVAAFLESSKIRWPGRRLVAVFQPHRYTRTRQYKEAFAGCFGAADAVFLKEVYAAGESPLPDGACAAIAGAWPVGDAPLVMEDLEALRLQLDAFAEKPAAVLFIGAGDIDAWASGFAATLKRGTSNAWWASLKAGLADPGCAREVEPLADKTTMRVGGAARFYAEPSSAGDLSHLLRSAHSAGVAVFVLGRGSNLIVADEGFDGLVVRLNHRNWKAVELLGDGRLRVGAGTRLKQLCAEARKLGLSGLEFLEGIPGSVGGSLRMNAGAMGGWMFDIVEEVEFMTMDGELLSYSRSAFTVAYRECRELRNAIALGAVVGAPGQSAPESISRTLDEYASKRKASQPREPSAGCIFKNPEGDYAGRLIDELGLKGRRVGAAQVSDVHGNFIVNLGNAAATDVLSLVREVRLEVKRKRGVELQPEVLLLGKTWEQVL